MGLSSSQARLLSLTGRMHDIEYKAQRLEAQKLQMANESAHVYQDYENALNSTRVQRKVVGADGAATFVDATYQRIIDNGYKIKFLGIDKPIVPQIVADNFVITNGNKDYFVHLQTGNDVAPAGYTGIYSVDDLQNMNLGGKYMLMADINMGGNNWTPIGSSTNPFTGTFDGNGHTISNFKIESSTPGTGFFNCVDGATITNIIVKDGIVLSKGNVGALVGIVKGNSSVSNCIAKNVNVSGDIRVGGLIGVVDGSQVSNCSSSGYVSGSEIIGGLVSYILNNSQVSDSLSFADVSGDECVGGFVGVVYKANVENSSAFGNVIGGRELGGFVGSLAVDSYITNSSASGNVTGIYSSSLNSNDYIWNYGGFAGINNSVITNSSASGNVTGLGNVGGFVGHNYLAQSVVNNSYSTGVVTRYAGGEDVGGFIGDNKPGATTTNCYYSSTSSTQSNGIGNNEGDYQVVTNASLSQIKNLASNGTIGAIGNQTSMTYPPISYKDTSSEAKIAADLFDEMSSVGYFIEGVDIENPAADHENDAVWFTNMLNEGFLYIYKKDNTTDEYYQTNVATDTNLQEISDKTDLRKAEAKYESSMRRIDLKDKKYDIELASLENERNAIKTEIDTLKAVAKDNVERTFKLFG